MTTTRIRSNHRGAAAGAAVLAVAAAVGALAVGEAAAPVPAVVAAVDVEAGAAARSPVPEQAVSSASTTTRADGRRARTAATVGGPTPAWAPRETRLWGRPRPVGGDSGGTAMDVGPAELLIILAIVLLLFGSAKLPKLARSLGQAHKEFKDVMAEGQR